MLSKKLCIGIVDFCQGCYATHNKECGHDFEIHIASIPNAANMVAENRIFILESDERKIVQTCSCELFRFSLLLENHTKIVRKLYKNRAKIVPKSYENRTKNRFKIVRELYKNCMEIVRKSYKNYMNIESIFF